MKRHVLLIGLILILVNSIVLMPALCEEVDNSVKIAIDEVVKDWFYCSVSNDVAGVLKWIPEEDVKLRKALEEEIKSFVNLDLSCDPPEMQKFESLGEDKYRVTFTVECVRGSAFNDEKEKLTKQAVLKRDSESDTWKIIEADLGRPAAAGKKQN